MWLIVLAAIIGISLGWLLPVPVGYARYTAVALLASFDSIVGAVRAHQNGKFDQKVFISGFFTNMVLAGGLTFLGDKLGVELYIAAIVAFGVRIFNNIALIRRHFL